MNLTTTHSSESEGNVGLWIAGVCVCSFGCFLAACGLGLQKMVHNRRDAEHEENPDVVHKAVYLEPWWMVGMFSIVVDAILDVISYGLAPQSLLAPLAALTMVFNTVLAPVFLHEKLVRSDIIGTIIITVGVVLTVSGAEKETPPYTINEIRALYQRVVAVIYAVIIIGILVALTLLANSLGAEHESAARLDLIKSPWKRKLAHMAYPMLGGIWGGQSIMMAKVAIELFKETFVGNSQLMYPETWLCLMILVLCLVMQTKFLNGGLARFDSLFIIPIYQVVWILAGICAGGIFFNEFAAFGVTDVILFTCGAIIIFFGVFFISSRSDPQGGVELEQMKYAVSAEKEDSSVSLQVEDVPAPTKPKGKRRSSIALSMGLAHTSMASSLASVDPRTFGRAGQTLGSVLEAPNPLE